MEKKEYFFILNVVSDYVFMSLPGYWLWMSLPIWMYICTSIASYDKKFQVKIHGNISFLYFYGAIKNYTQNYLQRRMETETSEKIFLENLVSGWQVFSHTFVQIVLFFIPCGNGAAKNTAPFPHSKSL